MTPDEVLERLEKLENNMGYVVAQLALAQADIKGLELDVEDLLNSRDEARRARATP